MFLNYSSLESKEKHPANGKMNSDGNETDCTHGTKSPASDLMTAAAYWKFNPSQYGKLASINVNVTS